MAFWVTVPYVMLPDGVSGWLTFISSAGGSVLIVRFEMQLVEVWAS